jgi:ARG/rhodanese/phosphatase superfamily protein
MTLTFPDVRVGDPIRHDGLTVFALFGESNRGVDYVLSDEAIEKGFVTVEEVSEAGSVPNLSVENKGDVRVLFLEGEELIGAKQNRILNISVLVAAHSQTEIPVSCVEAGRWGYRSRKFGSGGRHSPCKLRYHLKASVSQSLKAKRGYRSAQGEVWAEVSRQQEALGVFSGTSAMSDTFEAHRKWLDEFRKKVQYIEGVIGVAVAVGKRVVACDLFDTPSTCKKVWDRLLSGVVLDALELEEAEGPTEIADVERLLQSLGGFAWEAGDPVGEGEQLRAESPTGDHASALVFDDVLVHGSVVCESK